MRNENSILVSRTALSGNTFLNFDFGTNSQLPRTKLQGDNTLTILYLHNLPVQLNANEAYM